MHQLILFFQLCILILTSQALAKDCFKNSNDYKCKLGSKTPYRFIANHNETRPNFPGKIFIIKR